MNHITEFAFLFRRHQLDPLQFSCDFIAFQLLRNNHIRTSTPQASRGISVDAVCITKLWQINKTIEAAKSQPINNMSRKTIAEQIEDVVNETFLQDYNAILIINLDVSFIVVCLLLDGKIENATRFKTSSIKHRYRGSIFVSLAITQAFFISWEVARYYLWLN